MGSLAGAGGGGGEVSGVGDSGLGLEQTVWSLCGNYPGADEE